MMSGLFEHWIYKKNKDNTARYVLGEHGDNPLVCIGVNPSTATPDKLDPTLRQVRNRAKQLGYDGWIMLNLYPQRATNPDDLHERMKPDLHCMNWNHIHDIACEHNVKNVWCAWGTLIRKRAYLLEGLKRIHEVFTEAGCDWISIGPLSQAGHPHHPLYLAKDAPVEKFDINNYILGFER